MCLILLAYRYHPLYPLVIAANRDEFHTRPTAVATLWQEFPEIVAGRDLQSGGTWLGINRSCGRIAGVTNYRQPSTFVTENSRGHLVSDFLRATLPIPQYLQQCEKNALNYQGFNLILGDKSQLYYYSNRSKEGIQKITTGIHGLSNHLLNTPWPKIRKGIQGLHQLLDTTVMPSYQPFFELLYDTSRPTDAELPSTGIPLEQERLFSSLFIIDPEYGTRCSSLIIIDHVGQVDFLERSFTPAGKITQTIHIQFQSPHFKFDA